jgi:heme-degrading monooxygenase HmoA
MIRATLRMRVRPGMESAFEDAWCRVAAEAGRAPGNLRQTLLRDAEPRTYVVTSDWDSAAAFHTFERSPEQDALTAPLRALRESAGMSVQYIVLHVDSNGKDAQ